MRLLVALAFLLLAALLPAVEGQLAPTAITVDIGLVPAAGNSTTVAVEVTRHCANMAMVLDAQTVQVAVVARGGNWTFDGPSPGQFTQQVCAQQASQTIPVTFTVHPQPSAFAATAVDHPFQLRVRADAGSPTTPAVPEQTVPFTVTTAALPPAPVVEQPTREQPGLGLVGALLGLGAVALLLARHR